MLKASERFRLVFFFTVVLFAGALMVLLPNISIPMIIAYIFTLMLRPLRPLIYSRSYKKRTVYVIVSLFVLFLFIYPLIEIIPKLNKEASNIQYYIPKLEIFLREKYKIFRVWLHQKSGVMVTEGLIDDLLRMGEESSRSILLYLPTALKLLIEWSFLIPIFMFFFMRDGKNLKKNFLSTVPNQIFEKTYYLFHQFNTRFGDYIFAKSVEASIVGLMITIGLLIIGFPFAFLLGIIAGLTNVVPYLGPILGFIPAIVVGLVDSSPQYSIWAMIILYIVANIIDLAFVFPILVSKIVNLHPAVVVVSVMVGSQFAGVIGMVLSIPIAAFIKLLISEVYYGLYPRDIRT